MLERASVWTLISNLPQPLGTFGLRRPPDCASLINGFTHAASTIPLNQILIPLRPYNHVSHITTGNFNIAASLYISN